MQVYDELCEVIADVIDDRESRGQPLSLTLERNRVATEVTGAARSLAIRATIRCNHLEMI